MAMAPMEMASKPMSNAIPQFEEFFMSAESKDKISIKQEQKSKPIVPQTSYEELLTF